MPCTHAWFFSAANNRVGGVVSIFTWTDPSGLALPAPSNDRYFTVFVAESVIGPVSGGWGGSGGEPWVLYRTPATPEPPVSDAASVTFTEPRYQVVGHVV